MVLYTHTFYRFTTQPKEKPVVVVDYNKYMLGVDKLDQLCSYYSFLHKSVKWWRKVFFWLLEVGVVNSYVIHKEQCAKQGKQQITHLGYRRALIDSLTEPLRRVSSVNSGMRAPPSIERLQLGQHFLRKDEKRTDCVVCSDRIGGGQRHLTQYHCKTCSDDPAVCPTDCFRTYHTKKNFKSIS